MITFIDLFSGIGGFRLGLERSSEMYVCVWSCDNGRYANQVYTTRFGKEDHYPDDIRKLDPKEIPDFDLLCAGFPCQSFSVAGQRKGFQDTRGTLFYEIARIAEAKRPPLLLLENVKGLLSNDRGKTFAAILQVLGDLGYWAEWQVLNSKHFGVPQNRERVFVVGHLGERGGREVFPVEEPNGVSVENEEEGKGIASCLDANYGKGARRQRTFIVEGVTLANRSRYRQGVRRTPIKKDGLSFALGSSGDQGVMVYDGHHKQFTKEMGTLTGRENRQGTNWLVVADRTRSYANLGRNLENPKSTTNALSGVQKDNLLISKSVIRRLTPVECERLQGFPDNWTKVPIGKKWRGLRIKYVSDTQRYKLLGNAVTVNVIEYLGGRILGRCFQQGEA